MLLPHITLLITILLGCSRSVVNGFMAATASSQEFISESADTLPAVNCSHFSADHNGTRQTLCGEAPAESELPTEEVDPCTGQADGLYPNYTQQCNFYYRCENGSLISEEVCPLSLKFSIRLKRCAPEASVGCVEPVCHPAVDGVFWLPGTLCSTYYRCLQGRPILLSCPPGKQYNKRTQECETGVECFEPLCAGRSDGYHPDTTQSCARFLQCSAGVLRAAMSCPPGTLHDATTQSCLLATAVTCGPPQLTAVAVDTLNDDCRGYSDGAHVLPSSGCMRYQVCHDGRSVGRMTCPLGRRFDGLQCQNEVDVECEEPCVGLDDGFHPDTRQGCRKYFLCREGATVRRQSCPDGLLFTGATGMCLPGPLVSCPAPKPSPSRHNPCLGLSDGYHPDYLNRCTRYFYCSTFTPALTFSCPPDRVYSEGNCVQPTEGQCLDPRPNVFCHGLTTGLYQHLPSHCHDYVYCHEGNSTTLRCPEGKIFDGEECVSMKEYTCPSMELNTCFNQTDGYRLDMDSGCRAYYRCSNQQKTTYLCPPGQVFNGSVCVPLGDSPCPLHLTECTGRLSGYYPDYRTGCRSYFYCEHGAKLSTISCGPRRAFDGTKCVRTSNVRALCKAAAARERSQASFA